MNANYHFQSIQSASHCTHIFPSVTSCRTHDEHKSRQKSKTPWLRTTCVLNVLIGLCDTVHTLLGLVYCNLANGRPKSTLIGTNVIYSRSLTLNRGAYRENVRKIHPSISQRDNSTGNRNTTSKSLDVVIITIIRNF